MRRIVRWLREIFYAHRVAGRCRNCGSATQLRSKFDLICDKCYAARTDDDTRAM